MFRNDYGFRFVLAWLCFGMIYGVNADVERISLKKSDADVYRNAEKVLVGNCSAFLLNYTTDTKGVTGYGWSDGRDPDSSRHYRVDSARTLRTPYMEPGADATTYTFRGGSLLLTGGAVLANRSTTDDRASVVCINDLIIQSGTLSHGDWMRDNIWDGQFTVNGSVLFTINRKTCTISAKLISTPDSIVNCIPLSATAGQDSEKDYRWSVYRYSYDYRFAGDCSEHFATNYLNWGAVGYLDSATFAGSFCVGNAAKLEVGSGSASSVAGAIVGRDGWLDVATGKTLNAGALDFAFAPRATHVSGTYDVYFGYKQEGSAAAPYVNVNAIRDGRIRLNTITMQANANLTTGEAMLSGTLVEFKAGSLFTAETLDADQLVLDFSEGGRLAIAEALRALSPIKVKVDLNQRYQAGLVTLPVGKGVLSPTDFVLADGVNPYRYRLGVVIEGGLQKLTVEDVAPGTYDQTTGFVYLMESDGTSGATWNTSSFDEAGKWSDFEPPHTGTNYAVIGKTIRTGKTTDHVFGGNRLVMNGTLRVAQAGTLEIADWVLLTNGNASAANWPQITTSGGGYAMTLSGRATFLTTASCPFVFFGGAEGQTWTINMSFEGDETSAVAFGRPGVAANSVVAEYGGDASSYFGLLSIYDKVSMRLIGPGFPNATVVQKDTSSLVVQRAQGSSSSVGTYRIESGKVSVDVSEGNTLYVGAFDVSGQLQMTGAGLFVVSGSATVGSGASLSIENGSLSVRSATALDGVPLSFGSLATYVRDLQDPDADLIAKGLQTDAGISVDGKVKVEVRGATCGTHAALFTVPQAEAANLAGRLRFINRPAGCRGQVNLSPVDDGRVTISVDFVKTGLVLVFR